MTEMGQPGGREPAVGSLGLVQSFINTVDLEDGPDHLETVAGLRDFLVSSRLLRADEVVTEHERSRAIALREALRALASANCGAELTQSPIDVLNEFSETHPLVGQFTVDGSMQLRSIRLGVSGALGKILAAVYESIVEGSWSRLKACRNPRCQWVFYDQSKNQSGRWCAMATCGSRNKARVYQQRRKESGP